MQMFPHVHKVERETDSYFPKLSQRLVQIQQPRTSKNMRTPLYPQLKLPFPRIHTQRRRRQATAGVGELPNIPNVELRSRQHLPRRVGHVLERRGGDPHSPVAAAAREGQILQARKSRREVGEKIRFDDHSVEKQTPELRKLEHIRPAQSGAAVASRQREFLHGGGGRRGHAREHVVAPDPNSLEAQ